MHGSDGACYLLFRSIILSIVPFNRCFTVSIHPAGCSTELPRGREDRRGCPWSFCCSLRPACPARPVRTNILRGHGDRRGCVPPVPPVLSCSPYPLHRRPSTVFLLFAASVRPAGRRCCCLPSFRRSACLPAFLPVCPFPSVPPAARPASWGSAWRT